MSLRGEIRPMPEFAGPVESLFPPLSGSEPGPPNAAMHQAVDAWSCDTPIQPVGHQGPEPVEMHGVEQPGMADLLYSVRLGCQMEPLGLRIGIPLEQRVHRLFRSIQLIVGNTDG